MRIGAAEYRAAAEQHLIAAIHCHLNGDFLTCHYLCGLAVECILRAYRWRIDVAWDGRHVLPRLYDESGFDDLVSSDEATNIAASLSVITSRWSNEHRFTSEAKLQSHLNKVGATWNVKGDKLKKHSGEMCQAAEEIVGLGLSKWQN